MTPSSITKWFHSRWVKACGDLEEQDFIELQARMEEMVREAKKK